MAVNELNELNFDSEIRQGKSIVCVDDPNNETCKNFANVMMQLSQELPDIRFYRLTYSTSPNLVAKYQIKSIPAILVFNNGQLIGMGQGATPKDQLINHIKQAFQNAGIA